MNPLEETLEELVPPPKRKIWEDMPVVQHEPLDHTNYNSNIFPAKGDNHEEMADSK